MDAMGDNKQVLIIRMQESHANSQEFLHLENRLYSFQDFLQLMEGQAKQNLLFSYPFSEPTLKQLFDEYSLKQTPPHLDSFFITKLLVQLRRYNCHQLQKEARQLTLKIAELQADHDKQGSQHPLLNRILRRIIEQDFPEVSYRELMGYTRLEEGSIKKAEPAKQEKNWNPSVRMGWIKSYDDSQAGKLLDKYVHDVNRAFAHLCQLFNQGLHLSQFKQMQAALEEQQYILKQQLSLDSQQFQALSAQNQQISTFQAVLREEIELLQAKNRQLQDQWEQLNQQLEQQKKFQLQKLKLIEEQVDQLMTVFNFTLERMADITQGLDGSGGAHEGNTKCSHTELLQKLLDYYQHKSALDHLRRSDAAVLQLESAIEGWQLRMRERCEAEQIERHPPVMGKHGETSPATPPTSPFLSFHTIPPLFYTPPLSFSAPDIPEKQLARVSSLASVASISSLGSRARNISFNNYEQLSLNGSMMGQNISLYHPRELSITSNMDVSITLQPSPAHKKAGVPAEPQTNSNDEAAYRIVFASNDHMRRFKAAMDALNKK